MPESLLHDEVVSLLKALLSAWAARAPGSCCVARNLAVRWDEAHPAIGVDPDLCVLSPAPLDPRLRSVRTWRDGLSAPVLAIEVVSETNPRKDYTVAPDKYAASGTQELVLFDPLLSGPASHGGPVRLQVWQRNEEGEFVRVYAGEGPAYSATLQAWLFTVDDGVKLRVSSDAAGTTLWLTPEEAERAAKEAERAAKEEERAAKEEERAAKEEERAAKEEALARIAQLEAELAQRRA
jgi:Uma2 family endonuclease